MKDLKKIVRDSSIASSSSPKSSELELNDLGTVCSKIKETIMSNKPSSTQRVCKSKAKQMLLFLTCDETIHLCLFFLSFLPSFIHFRCTSSFPSFLQSFNHFRCKSTYNFIVYTLFCIYFFIIIATSSSRRSKSSRW